MKTDAGLKVVEASLDDFGTLLFKSIHEYNIDPNVISGSRTQSQILSRSFSFYLHPFLAIAITCDLLGIV